MRGDDIHQDAMFSYLSREQDNKVPLRPLRQMVNWACGSSTGTFRPCVPLRGATLCRRRSCSGLCSSRFCTPPQRAPAHGAVGLQPPVRWFVGLMDDKVWDHSVFSKNWERFLNSNLAAAFFGRIKSRRPGRTVVGRAFHRGRHLIEAWASLKSSGQRYPAARGWLWSQSGSRLPWGEAPEQTHAPPPTPRPAPRGRKQRRQD